MADTLVSISWDSSPAADVLQVWAPGTSRLASKRGSMSGSLLLISCTTAVITEMGSLVRLDRAEEQAVFIALWLPDMVLLLAVPGSSLQQVVRYKVVRCKTI